ncbi:hypothetical protein BN8_00255 [Fibrisoma limi BUZ 3]|uniref:1,4-alpha-glucan branching enzyme n=1 Tax=Fibrisoma limi BUZ 3 TaxID=1185876 RepID=I2GBR3_9BACT|nr:hypothetical protein [Fibrisoma limi]CCH51337.1 hypothetical protein BN8_00255 [Fibrisoma limi BUZ 3]
MASAKTTTNHDEIRTYVEERDGKPARVKGTEKNGDGSGVIRIDFPAGAGEDKLEAISWDEFFEEFDKNNLAMLYQEETKDGNESRFVKFVNRD